MTIMQLCESIGLPQPVCRLVGALKDSLDFSAVDALLPDFYHREKMKTVHTTLKNCFGEDPGHMKLLTAMLYASAAAQETYRRKGIPEEIYIDTMKCYARFLRETFDRTGRWDFDRYWWTARQAGCHLFRIGQLEYEIKQDGGRDVIGIHIPSDAQFSPDKVDDSLAAAEKFFKDYYPELAECDYICHSWLMDRRVGRMLDSGSNIVNFQNRFEIYNRGGADGDFLQWLFRTQNCPYEDLPENTSLQKRVKNHLLSGGLIYESYGRLLRSEG